MSLSNIPTTITIVRLLLAPVVAMFVLRSQYAAAAGLFFLAALSDFADGAIARYFGFVSELGARLDAIADKALMLVTVIALAWAGPLPLWLAAAIVVRDVVVLTGAIAYRILLGHVEMAPSLLSKLNTALEFLTVAAVMVNASDMVVLADWLPMLYWATLATIVASGLQYVWVWSRKALSERGSRAQ